MKAHGLNNNIGIAWCEYLLFASLLFSKCLLFQWNVFHSILISSIFTNPLYFWSFWLPKIGIALLIPSFVLFFRRNWWTIVFALIIDVWMLANMFYLRSNGKLFDGFTFTMASNMDGFWSSIWVLFNWSDILPFVLTLIYTFLLIVLNHLYSKDALIRTAGIVCLFTIVFNQWSFALVKKSAMLNYNGEDRPVANYLFQNPMSYEYRRTCETLNRDYAFYYFSVIHALVFISLDNIHNLHAIYGPYQIQNKEELKEKLQMGSNRELAYNNLLLIIVVESLESWTIQETIMPHIQHFINTHPVLYAKYLRSQIKGGLSADGQMIINTGLLPIKQGATCFRYPWITFPSLTNRQDSSITILTHGITTWNQDVMSRAYGYDITLGGTAEDSVLSQRIINYAQRGYRTIQGVTVASHIPFEYASRSDLDLPVDMPADMQKYLKCLNWTDEGLGYLLERVDSIPELANATIVLTGDHTIFWPEKRSEFEKYCLSANQSYEVQKGYVPLIIYSPNRIANTLVLEDINYQMDIYPTVLDIKDADDYYWRGFGVSLLDSASRHSRTWSEIEAFNVSDELIRANWFAIYNQD